MSKSHTTLLHVTLLVFLAACGQEGGDCVIEETGYRANTVERLTGGPVSAGMSNEALTFFRGRGLRRIGDGGGDDSEDITVHRVPVDEVVAFCAAAEGRGTLVDPKVFVGLFFARCH